MEEKILEIIRETFELATVDRSVSQNNCEAWDSMGQLNLIAELEEVFDISLEPEEIGEMKCFEDVLRIVSSKI